MYGSIEPKGITVREPVEVKPTTFHLHYLWHPPVSTSSTGS
jgi:hypothetical protein